MKKLLTLGAIGLASLISGNAKAECHNASKQAKVCTIRSPEKILTFYKGFLNDSKGPKLCQVTIAYSNGDNATYSAIGCKGKVTSLVKTIGNKTTEEARNSENLLKFRESIDPTYRSLENQLTGELKK